MILLIEPDKTVRKKLCDLLSKERIIGIDNISQSLELMIKYKQNLNVLIVNIRLLHKILTNQIISKLCKKLTIKKPPIVGVYMNGDKKLMETFVKKYTQYNLIKYDEKEYSFPSRYIETIKEAYPELHVDIEKAKQVWLKEQEVEDLADLRNWIKEQGFETVDKKEVKKPEALKPTVKKPLKKQGTAPKVDEKKDYKKMYFEIKKKYDELLKYVQELTDSL